MAEWYRTSDSSQRYLLVVFETSELSYSSVWIILFVYLSHRPYAHEDVQNKIKGGLPPSLKEKKLAKLDSRNIIFVVLSCKKINRPMRNFVDIKFVENVIVCSTTPHSLKC